MKYPSRTHQELLEEISVLKQRIKELEQPETEHVRAGDVLLESEDQRIVLALVRDITIRKEAEEKLQQQTDAIEASMDGIAILDENQNYVYANEAHLRIYNYDTSEELIGKSWRILYNEDELKRFDHDIMPEFSKKGQWRGEATGKKKDGSSFLQEVSLTALDNGGLICVVRDITERKEAEKALQESERKFRDLSEKSFVGIYLVQDGIFKYINARLAEILGYTIEEILDKKRPIDLVVSEDVPIVTENIQKSISGEIDSLHHKFRVITKNQEIKNVEVFGSSTIYKGRPAVIGTLVDITDRKRTEEALKESESRFRALAENSPASIFVIQGEKYIYVNPAFTKTTGYTHDDLSSMNFWDVVHPDMRHLVKARGMARQSREDMPPRYELKFITKSGQTGFGDFGATSIEFQGKPAVLGSVFDITERKRTEEALRESESKFRDMAEKSVVGIYLVQDGLFKYANAKFAEIFGYPIEEIAGIMRAEDAILPEDWPVVEENLRKRISGELESLHYEFRIVTKSRDVRHAEIYSSRTIYQGKPAVIGTLLDITERKNLETQLLQSQKMEAIGTLAGGIAHDFNNILTALMGYASLMQIKMDESSPLRPYVDQVLSASEKAADLTKSLLAFSRQQPVTLVPLDINNTITTTRQLLKRLLTEDIELRTSLTKDDTTAMADRSQIDQILFNLATNARDAMPKGGTLIIGTDSVHIDGDFMGSHGFGEFGRYVVISVSDTGEGIDEATKRKIFDPFFTTKEIGKGTGLGLATVYGIVKQHNGYITVYSKPGRGTTFRIYFPAVNMKTSQETDTATPNATGNETILIAEDNEGVRRFIQEALREHGYKTIEARDGEDAVGKFKKHRGIDLIIIDSVMPKKNGREVYEEIRGTDPHIRVLFTSGYTKDIVLNKGIEDKELDFISKPLSLNVLLRKVREVLDRQ